MNRTPIFIIATTRHCSDIRFEQPSAWTKLSSAQHSNYDISSTSFLLLKMWWISTRHKYLRIHFLEGPKQQRLSQKSYVERLQQDTSTHDAKRSLGRKLIFTTPAWMYTCSIWNTKSKQESATLFEPQYAMGTRLQHVCWGRYIVWIHTHANMKYQVWTHATMRYYWEQLHVSNSNSCNFTRSPSGNASNERARIHEMFKVKHYKKKYSNEVCLRATLLFIHDQQQWWPSKQQTIITKHSSKLQQLTSFELSTGSSHLLAKCSEVIQDTDRRRVNNVLLV